jgi:hypothetical protein
MSISTKVRAKEFRIYKPNKTKNGSAIKFQGRYDEKSKYPEWLMFLDGAIQTGEDENGNASFGWKEADKFVTLKLGIPDVSDLLAVISGRKVESKLYHENTKGNTQFTFTHIPDKGYRFRLSSQRDGKVVAVPGTISYAEGEVIRVLFENWIWKTFS